MRAQNWILGLETARVLKQGRDGLRSQDSPSLHNKAELFIQQKVGMLDKTLLSFAFIFLHFLKRNL